MRRPAQRTRTSPAPRVARVVALPAAALLLATSGSGAQAAVTGPQDLARPTAKELADSVISYDTAGSVIVYEVPGGVTVYDLDGSVEPLKQEEESEGRTVVTLNSDVLFAFGSDRLSAGAAAAVDALAARMPERGAVEVDGYTDAVGGTSANLDLSKRRAAAVAARITSSRPNVTLRVTGHGEADPVAPNTVGGEDDPVGRAQNRRVTIGFTS